MKNYSVNKGFETLMSVHKKALDENSKELIEILELLSEKKLDEKSLSQIKDIRKEIKSIDKKIDSLGKESYGI